jgi:hypothetical protein
MQEKSETFRNFSRRSDVLALALGIDLGELATRLDMGRASFFSYRTGKRPISGKAWAKLEAAETAAGIIPEGESPDTHPPPARVTEAPVPPGYCRPDLASLPGRMLALEMRMARIEEMLARMIEAPGECHECDVAKLPEI